MDSEEDPDLTEGKTGVQVQEPGAQVHDGGLQQAGLQGNPQYSYVQLGRTPTDFHGALWSYETWQHRPGAHFPIQEF